jgi:ribosomal protein L6P/L9E
MYSFSVFFDEKMFSVLLKNKQNYYIVATLNEKHIKLKINLPEIVWNKTASIATLKKFENLKDIEFLRELGNKVNNWDNYFYSKITFKGKGYKVKRLKKKKILKLAFGHSHLFKAFFIKSTIKKLGKYKYILLSWNFKQLHQSLVQLIKYRHINMYTKRGLRTRRMLIKKRTGKKSQK